MELIKKQISIDACRSHKAGLLPAILFNIDLEENDIPFSDYKNENPDLPKHNYGHFVCDLKNKENGQIIKYLDIIRRYNNVKEILRQGIICEKTRNEDGHYGLKEIVDKLEICSGETPETIYECQPLNIYDFTKTNDDIFITNKEYLSEDDISISNRIIDSDFCILVNDYEYISKIEKWGINNGISSSGLGSYFTFIQYVENNLIFKNNPVGFSLVIPTVDIPIFLEEEYMLNTLYYPYEYTLTGESCLVYINGEYFSGIISDGTIIPFITSSLTYVIKIDDETAISAITSSSTYFMKIGDEIIEREIGMYQSGLTIESESKLNRLIHPSAFNIDENIFGIPKELNEFYQENSGYTGNTEILQCFNGEDIDDENKTKAYRTIPFLSCSGYIENYSDYIFLVKYENNEDNPIDIPFKINEKLNLDGEYYDKVIGIEYPKDSNKIIITYEIGCTDTDSGRGITYQEELNYVKESATTFVDGFKCDIWYKKIDFDTNLKEVYNDEYKTNLKYRPANIIGMPVGDETITCNCVISGGSETGEIKPIKPFLFTKEGSDSLIADPHINIDLIFNRGNAAGWEKHFKLTECNTMQDLENYGNNFFNL